MTTYFLARIGHHSQPLTSDYRHLQQFLTSLYPIATGNTSLTSGFRCYSPSCLIQLLGIFFISVPRCFRCFATKIELFELSDFFSGFAWVLYGASSLLHVSDQ